MPHNQLELDQISQMIKRKIVVTENRQVQLSKEKTSLLRSRMKEIKKVPPKSNFTNLSSNIVIMNMPPMIKLDFMDEQFVDKRAKMSKTVRITLKKPQLFSNPHISNQLRRCESNAQNESHFNNLKSINDNSQQVELKRYNSLNIRLSDMSSNQTMDSPRQFERMKGLVTGSTFCQRKIALATMEFKPSFRQLLKRNSNEQSKLQSKLRKSQFNYQRAISTSVQSRRKSFQRLLATFQEVAAKKLEQNPQPNNKLSESPLNQTQTSRQFSTRCRTRLFSPEGKMRNQKQEEACRPWSAGKKNLIKLHNAEEQNPLQFYSINDKH